MENEEKEEADDQDFDATLYEPCQCERCVEPKITYTSRFIAWLDHTVLKRCLVYNYTPEDIIAQNEV